MKMLISGAVTLTALICFAGTAAAQVTGQAGAYCGSYNVSTVAGVKSAGEACLAADQYNYGSGDRNKVMVVPPGAKFTFNPSEGPNPNVTGCTFSASGNSLNGGGYLSAGTGRSLNCEARVGNGSNRGNQSIVLNFR